MNAIVAIFAVCACVCANRNETVWCYAHKRKLYKRITDWNAREWFDQFSDWLRSLGNSELLRYVLAFQSLYTNLANRLCTKKKMHQIVDISERNWILSTCWKPRCLCILANGADIHNYVWQFLKATQRIWPKPEIQFLWPNPTSFFTHWPKGHRNPKLWVCYL